MAEWIPDPIEVLPWDDRTYDMLYEVFCNSIRDAVLNYYGSEIWFYRDQLDDNRETLFWHLTTRKPRKVPRRKEKFLRKGTLKSNSIRFPDPRRCERLCWVNPIICNCHKDDVLDWNYLEGDGSTKTYLWLRKYSFVVILKYTGNNRRRLITSYYVDCDNTRISFEEKYEKRITK